MRSWRLKPFMFFILVVFNALFLLLIITIFYFKMSSFFTKQISEVRLEQLTANQQMITERLGQIEDTALLISTHSLVKNGLNRKFSQNVYDSIVIRREINEWLNKFTYTMPYISSIQIYTDYFSYHPHVVGSRNNIVAPLMDIPWKEDLSRLKEFDAIWIPSYQWKASGNINEQVLTYVLKIYDWNGDVAGYVAINLDSTSLYHYFMDSSYDSETQRMIMILDRNDRSMLQISSISPDLLPPDQYDYLLSQMKMEQGYQVLEMDLARYLAIYTDDRTSNWRLIELISSEEVYQDLRSIRNLTFMIGGIALLLLFPVASYISNRIISPVPSLLRGFKRIEEGNFNIKLKKYFIMEINELSQSFNRMAVRLQALLHDLNKEHRQKRDLEIRVLQSQINPHFLYNTLDIINLQASLDSNHELSLMAVRLAKLLRISVKDTSFITLKEELVHARSYVQIQQIRFKDKFQYIENIDPELKSCYVPKIIIQPFVENALIHGFSLDMTDRKAMVKVTAVKPDSHSMKIIIEDNGTGIPQDSIIPNGKKDALYVSGSSGYGIKNVHDRIQMYFGSKYGVRLERGEQEGVCVTITLPFKECLELNDSMNPVTKEGCYETAVG